jgi:hypothetical protein
MTLSAALDSGLAFGVVVVFFGVLWPGWGWVGGLEWWGTRVYREVSTIRGERGKGWGGMLTFSGVVGV